MTLGEKLRSVRQEKGLSQNQVAGSYMTRNMLSQLEHDQASPSVRTLQYLAKVLEVPVGWLLDGETCGNRITKQAKALYQSGQYLECVELLSCSQEMPDDEQALLLFRSALSSAARFLKEGRLSQASSMLDAADRCRSLYLGPSDRSAILTMKLRCVLAEGKTDEALLQAVLEASDSGELEALTVQHDLLKGQELVEEGRYADALLYLHRAEAAAKPGAAELRRIYRLLERCYQAREDYKTAYHYVCLRTAPD